MEYLKRIEKTEPYGTYERTMNGMYEYYKIIFERKEEEKEEYEKRIEEMSKKCNCEEYKCKEKEMKEIKGEQEDEEKEDGEEEKEEEKEEKEEKKGIKIKDIEYNIESLIASSNTKWTEPEWGFPKGRRNYQYPFGHKKLYYYLF